ncbi:MAG: hypothetical protein J7M34_11125 [Anaerolineae bacterium]|nr:hypothetical protein [Anaerolineae bacterium]
MQDRYLQASRRERGALLDEVMEVTQLHRKTLIRLLRSDLCRHPRSRQRGRTYSPEVDDALRVIDESMDYICAERLHPNLPWLAEQLARHGELMLTDSLRTQLAQLSLSTVRRISRRSGDYPHLTAESRRALRRKENKESSSASSASLRWGKAC